MKIGLIDVDGHHYPNLCLMKLSGWHKAKGDDVEWYQAEAPQYDIVYMSKIFSNAYTQDIPEPINAKKVIKGGTGYAIWLENGKEVYHPELDPPLSLLRLSTNTLTTVFTRNIPGMVCL